MNKRKIWYNISKKEIVMDDFTDIITIDADICHGKPTIRGLRYPVEMILQLLSSGMMNDEILEDYEDLTKEDILACLAFAAKLTEVKSTKNLVAA